MFTIELFVVLKITWKSHECTLIGATDFINSLHKYLLKAYYVSDTVLGIKNTIRNTKGTNI